jgi:hypothetical protein
VGCFLIKFFQGDLIGRRRNGIGRARHGQEEETGDVGAVLVVGVAHSHSPDSASA